MKTTRWFPNNIRPVRDGWYQVKTSRKSIMEFIGEDGEPAPMVMRYWHSVRGWLWCRPGETELVQSSIADGLWRGLDYHTAARLT